MGQRSYCFSPGLLAFFCPSPPIAPRHSCSEPSTLLGSFSLSGLLRQSLSSVSFPNFLHRTKSISAVFDILPILRRFPTGTDQPKVPLLPTFFGVFFFCSDNAMKSSDSPPQFVQETDQRRHLFPSANSASPRLFPPPPRSKPRTSAAIRTGLTLDGRSIFRFLRLTPRRDSPSLLFSSRTS